MIRKSLLKKQRDLIESKAIELQTNMLVEGYDIDVNDTNSNLYSLFRTLYPLL